MGSINVQGLGKAYKQYPSRISRLYEWFTFGIVKKRHILKWVLKDISFSIQSGESVGIVGVNGAGKSTLLKILTGTTRPTKGECHVVGKVSALLELGMGFHPDFTGRQNAIMSAQLMGMNAEQISDLLPEIEGFAEIGDYIDQPVRIYSSGMQVRLAFSVATAVRPDILIVDEALSVGDAYFQAKCYKRISEYQEAGTTLLLVSHSPTDIVKHCDRAILIQDGQITLDSSSREVSNVYLDILFGAKKPKEKIKDKSKEYQKVMSDDFDDVFHTKFGYRKEEHRWGLGGASILDFLISSQGQKYPAKIQSNEFVDFYFKVHFHEDMDSIIPGILIKTLEGIFLYGTNSFVSSREYSLISVAAGELREFKFSLPMKLNEGYYLISFGVSSGFPPQELIPLDRRYDSVLIYVERKLGFWGLIDLEADFCINDGLSIRSEE